jgi:metal-sulfur cluster biosynthetic enzyme
MRDENKRRDIRVTNLSTNQHLQIKNIASHVGCSMGELIKSNVHIILQQYPKDYRDSPLSKD